MPLPAAINHTFTGRTAGGTVGAEEFATVVGDMRYVDVSGDMAITTANQAAGTAAYVQEVTGSDSKFGQLSIAFVFGGAPSTAMELAALRDSTSPQTKSANLLGNVSGGNPTIKPRGGGDANLTGWTSDYTCTIGTKYVLSIAVQIGTTTSNGKTKARLTTLADQGTVLASGEGTAFSNGLNYLANARVGKQGSGGTVDFKVLAMAFWDNAYDYLAIPTDTPPTPEGGSEELVWDGTAWS